jgi:PAS domain S-box-containing protein
LRRDAGDAAREREAVCIALLAAPGGPAEVRTRGALTRLGPEARVETHVSAAALLRRARAGGVDLLVLDGSLAEAQLALAGRRADDPPALVVAPDADEDSALAVFRRGAADCVTLGPQYEQVLPAAALEQIQRYRAAAERGAAETLSRQVEELRRFGQNVIQNMNSALVVVDLGGAITFANPAAERILGAAPDTLAGATLWRWFEGGLRGRLVERTLREGVRFRGAEGVIARTSGERVPIGTSCAPLVDRDGVRRGAIVIFQDLSEIKQLQRQVLQAEKMASIGQLAAGVAHEINNPMGFIHANLFQLGEYLQDLRRLLEAAANLRKAAATGSLGEVALAAGELDAAAAEVDADYLIDDCGKAVRESLEGAERIRHIVQDLRAFSHPDASEPVEADLNECLDSTANIVWTMMKRAVVLRKEYADLPGVRCFPMQLKQVFMNLLVNACQAIEDARAASGRTGEIRLRTRAVPGGVVVEVEDDGVGIRADDLPRIFDPFFTTKEVGAGTGLGLSISYNIVKRHGGCLRVESEPGVRTCFEVFLPRDGLAQAEPAP